MIVVSLENGANINDVCRELRICNAGKAPTTTITTTDLTQYALDVCSEWHQSHSVGGKTVS